MSAREDQIQGVKDALECGGGVVRFKSTAESEGVEFYARIAQGVEIFDGQYSRVVTTLRALKSDLVTVGASSTFVDEDGKTFKFLEILRSDGVAMQIVIREIEVTVEAEG